MQKLFAALVGAAAAMPPLACAASTFPDPSDPGAPVPVVTVASVFADYHAYEDKGPGSWTSLNHAAMDTPGMAGMSHGQIPPPGGSAAQNGHSRHGGMSK
jgi:uncharacterized protein involved in copper resistance